MQYEWNDHKSKTNMEKHGVSFDRIYELCWEDALIGEDTRQDYNETRYRALGPIGDRLHLLAYTMRKGLVRIISLRRANQREFNYYVSQIDSTD